MSTDRRHALAAGIFYLLTFATSIPALALKDPVLARLDLLGTDSGRQQLLWAVALELVLAAACVGTAVALYPLVSRVTPTAALGFVAARTIEAGLVVVGVLALMTLATTDRGTTDPALVALHDAAFLIGPGLVPAVNALCLGWALYRARLVPRAIPLVGMVGAPLLELSATATLFGVLDQVSMLAALAAAPIALWEFSLGTWLTFRGVRGRAGVPPNHSRLPSRWLVDRLRLSGRASDQGPVHPGAHGRGVGVGAGFGQVDLPHDLAHLVTLFLGPVVQLPPGVTQVVVGTDVDGVDLLAARQLADDHVPLGVDRRGGREANLHVDGVRRHAVVATEGLDCGDALVGERPCHGGERVVVEVTQLGHLHRPGDDGRELGVGGDDLRILKHVPIVTRVEGVGWRTGETLGGNVVRAGVIDTAYRGPVSELRIQPGPGLPGGLVIPAGELAERYSHASGPGGQGVNTTDSRVQLSFDVAASKTLDERQRERVMRRLDGRLVGTVLTVVAAESRSQRRNRAAARERMAELVRDALAPPPPPRRATRPTKGSITRRLSSKRRRAEVKKMRANPDQE